MQEWPPITNPGSSWRICTIETVVDLMFWCETPVSEELCYISVGVVGVGLGSVTCHPGPESRNLSTASPHMWPSSGAVNTPCLRDKTPPYLHCYTPCSDPSSGWSLSWQVTTISARPRPSSCRTSYKLVKQKMLVSAGRLDAGWWWWCYKMQVPVCRVGDPTAAAVLQSLSLPPTAVTSAERRQHQAEVVPYIRHSEPDM